MANSKVEDLSAIGTIAANDVMYIVDVSAGVGGMSKVAMSALASYLHTSPTLTGATLTGTTTLSGASLIITGATETASNPVLNATQTWNNPAVAFTLDKMNVTSTQSDPASLLIDRRVGDVSYFNVRKDGQLNWGNNANNVLSGGGLGFLAGAFVGWATRSSIYSDANGSLAFRNNAETQSCYVKWGAATPEGAITAPVGAIFLRTDGGAATTLYVKESGTGNTGWVGK